MSKQTSPDDEKLLPNQTANKEPAEGSRETVRDSRESLKRGRESHIVHPDAEERERQSEKSEASDRDPVMPTGDSRLRTKI
jgi:hypothetical protein